MISAQKSHEDVAVAVLDVARRETVDREDPGHRMEVIAARRRHEEVTAVAAGVLTNRGEAVVNVDRVEAMTAGRSHTEVAAGAEDRRMAVGCGVLKATAVVDAVGERGAKGV